MGHNPGAKIARPGASGAPWLVSLTGLAVVLFWGGSFTLSKLALPAVGPLGLAFYRWLVATLFFAIYLPARGLLPAARLALRRDGLRLALLGFVGITLLYVLQNWGLTQTSAVNSGIIMNSTGLFVAVLGILWLGERPTVRGGLGVILAFGGMVLIVRQSGTPGVNPHSLTGDLITVAAALAAAVYSVYGKPVVERTPPAVVTGLAAAFGTLLLLPVVFLEGFSVPEQPIIWLWIGLLGIGSSALANLWWWRLLEHTEAGRAGTLLFLIPVVSSLLAVVTLGETLTLQTAAGALLVLSGLAVQNTEENSL